MSTVAVQEAQTGTQWLTTMADLQGGPIGLQMKTAPISTIGRLASELGWIRSSLKSDSKGVIRIWQDRSRHAALPSLSLPVVGAVSTRMTAISMSIATELLTVCCQRARARSNCSTCATINRCASTTKTPTTKGAGHETLAGQITGILSSSSVAAKAGAAPPHS